MKTAIYTAVGAWYRQSVTATIAAIMAEPGKVVVPWRQWAFTNLSSLWFVLPPLASLLAAYAPRRLFRTYFNLFLRRLLNVVDPYATVDISEPGAEVRYSRRTRASSAPRAPRTATASSSASAMARTSPTTSAVRRSGGPPWWTRTSRRAAGTSAASSASRSTSATVGSSSASTCPTSAAAAARSSSATAAAGSTPTTNLSTTRVP
ncbi:unnamed protein product [Urochloa humidicola]